MQSKSNLPVLGKKRPFTQYAQSDKPAPFKSFDDWIHKPSSKQSSFEGPSKRRKISSQVDESKDTDHQVSLAKPFADQKISVTDQVPECSSETLQELLQFKVPLTSADMYPNLFAKIADAYLNRTVLVVKRAGEADAEAKYYRVCEIEFYLNDNALHKDTFTHGDPMQKKTGVWYFHRQKGTYKSGTYKGLDLAIGKSDEVSGGILLRSLMPLTVKKDPTTGEISGFSSIESKKDFIEGPCNSVNQMLADTKPKGLASFDIKDLVAHEAFSTTCDAFDQKSCLHLKPLNAAMSLGTRKVWSCPRVGLTLKRYDVLKEKRFWMADYRFVTYPAFHGKMKDFIILGMIKSGLSRAQLSQTLTGTNGSKLELMETHFKEGQALALAGKKTVKQLHKDSMKGQDWATVYGVHQVLVDNTLQ